MSKYDLTSSQTAYQFGSNDRVLVNKLNITDPSEMNEVELLLLGKLYDRVLTEQLPPGVISTQDIKSWHKLWLGVIYEWAGKERSVNMTKDDFHFAASGRIPALLKTLDRDYLSRWTPCADLTDGELINAIAVVHVEFILIHPFRDGNGRIARLLADVMAVQAGYGTLDYSPWDQNKTAYVRAIHAGLNGDYVPMMGWVEQAFNAV